MKVIISIGHPAHVNFFKPIAQQLKVKGHVVIISVLKRGKLPEIAKKELNEYPLFFIGKHRATKWSILIEANFGLFFRLLIFCLKNRPDFGISAGGFVLGAVLKLIGVPNIQFDDDPERKVNVFLEKLTATKLYFPVFYEDVNEKIRKYNALKEWSYLSPTYFKPNINIIKEYGLTSGKYVFVREISTGSLNYVNQKKNIIASICHDFQNNTQYVLSLEDKTSINQYPANWIILKEPLEDIHSLIYFSKCLISSGDSMAREGSILGVPSIFCGDRKMKANDVMINKGMMFKEEPLDAAQRLNNIINNVLHFEDQISFRDNLLKEWVDVAEHLTGLIVRKLD